MTASAGRTSGSAQARPGPEAGAALSLRGVSVAFSGVRALDDVTFDVPAGGIVALIGPNGAGKTTLLNCVSGLYRHSGDILVDGALVSDSPAHTRARSGVGRTFQTPALLDDESVLDNVLLGAHPAGRGWRRADRRRAQSQVRDRALALLDAFGMGASAEHAAGDLPHGGRRRVETARALLLEPSLLLLDEPGAGLDDDEAHELLSIARRHAGTCVLVEHNMQLVMSLARHVVVLASGRLLAEGSPAQVATDPRVVEAYLGDGVL